MSEVERADSRTQEMESSSCNRPNALAATLLEYQRLTGTYQRALRQPALLYECIPEILQVAGGRADATDASNQGRLREAACFFIGSALLYPDADHYQLLGLERTADAATIKERYRLMMRLLHPDLLPADMTPANWPVDSAVRVNRAYGVLSSPDQRRTYDLSISAPKKPMPASVAPGAASPVRTTGRRIVADPRRHLKRLTLVFGTTGAVALLFIGLAGRPNDEGLVQRAPRVESKVAAATTDNGSVSVSPPLALPPEKRADNGPPNESLASGTIQVAPRMASEPQPQPEQRSAHPHVLPASLASSPAAVIHSSRLAGVATFASQEAPSLAIPPTAAAPAVPAVASPPVASATVLPTVASPPPASPIVTAPTSQPVSPPTLTSVASLPVAPLIAAKPAAAVPDPSRASTNMPLPQAGVADAAQTSKPAPAAVLPQLSLQSPSRQSVATELTLAEVQPLLSTLLQNMESGLGDRLLALLSIESRADPSAQALLLHYNSLVGGAGPVKLSHVHFKSEPREGRLIVTGFVRLHIGEQAMGGSSKDLNVQAEFVSREGKVVLMGLARARGS